MVRVINRSFLKFPPTTTHAGATHGIPEAIFLMGLNRFLGFTVEFTAKFALEGFDLDWHLFDNISNKLVNHNKFCPNPFDSLKIIWLVTNQLQKWTDFGKEILQII
jgi:hypothetical protein